MEEDFELKQDGERGLSDDVVGCDCLRYKANVAGDDLKSAMVGS